MTKRVECRECGRPLKSPMWRARRIGPVCARKAGLVVSAACPTVLVRAVRAAEPGEGQLALIDVMGKVVTRLDMEGGA